MRTLFTLLLVCGSILSGITAQDEPDTRPLVVASASIFADMAKNISGGEVRVEPDGVWPQPDDQCASQLRSLPHQTDDCSFQQSGYSGDKSGLNIRYQSLNKQ